jgi:hypothetical protein
MSSNNFWAAAEAQLRELRSATNAADVVAILSLERNPDGPGMSCADGFFAGSGGDDTVQDALEAAGWDYVWPEASYHFCMRAPDGSCITYVEGDIYLGNRRPVGNV